MADPVTWGAIISAVAGAGASVYSSEQQKKTQEKQMNVQKEMKAKEEKMQQEALLAEQRPVANADLGALMAGNMNKGQTNLTGGGAQAGSGNLGGNRLLG